MKQIFLSLLFFLYFSSYTSVAAESNAIYKSYHDIPSVFIQTGKNQRDEILRAGFSFENYMSKLADYMAFDLNDSFLIEGEQLKGIKDNLLKYRENIQLKSLVTYDLNRDGQIIEEEIEDYIRQASKGSPENYLSGRIKNEKNNLFIKYDHNKDRVISYTEMATLSDESYKRALGRGLFPQKRDFLWLDPTKNDGLSAQDFKFLTKKVYDTIDINRDNIISFDEHENFKEAVQKTNNNTYINSQCVFPDISFPKNMKIYAASADMGRTPDDVNQIKSEKKKRFKQIDLKVLDSSQPISLILNGVNHSPTLWNLDVAEDVNIHSIVVYGPYIQEFVGLSPNTQVLRNYPINDAPCGRINFSALNQTIINPVSRQLFNKPANMMFKSLEAGRFVISSDYYETPAFQEKRNAELASEQAEDTYEQRAVNYMEIIRNTGHEYGVGKDIHDGVLRFAKQEDLDDWKSGVIKKIQDNGYKKPDVPQVAGEDIFSDIPTIFPDFEQIFVITKSGYKCEDITNSLSDNTAFILSKGLHLAKDANCSKYNVFDMNTYTCVGSSVSNDRLNICKYQAERV